TPWKVTDRRSADTILEGEIVSVGSQPISRDRFTTLPQEQLFTIRMNLLLKDLRTGRILMERRDYEQSVSYYPTLGEGTFTGQQESVERLAVAIVRELESDW